MNNLIEKLILYGRGEESNILNNLGYIFDEYKRDYDNLSYFNRDLAYEINKLINLAMEYGFSGNLWQCYLTHILMRDVNAFSTAFEKKEFEESSLSHFAENDLGIFFELFNYNFDDLERDLKINHFTFIKNFTQTKGNYPNFNSSIQELGIELYKNLASAKTKEEFFEIVCKFYSEVGVGKLGLYKAFRIVEADENIADLIPISNLVQVKLSDIVGYESQKEELYKNTKAFVDGIVSNNVLLYGDSGTGKSTSIRAIANEFYGDGLRMIEVYKHQLKYLSKIIGEIKNRNYKFIIYMDDLSFEDFETDYKYLKSLIEGRLEARPTNVLVYATSNRRHLIKETWKDRNDMEIDGEIHKSDNLEEKLSLSSRFGVTIQFLKPLQEGYLNIVRELAKRHGINMSIEELEAEAIAWERSHGGGRTGRTAEQFINYLKISH